MTSKLISSYSNANTSSASRDEPQPQWTNVTVYFAEHLIAEILCCLPVDFGSLDNATAVEIDEPWKTLFHDTRVVGSFNGILCLFNPEVDMFLWNPATRKCMKLPTVPTEFRRPMEFGWCAYCGFGYEAVNDDYKVLRILRPDDQYLSDYKVTVYSLKTNSWRRLQNISSHFRLVGPWGMFLGGALHWITVKALGLENCPSILAFDLGAENCREVPMPHKIGEELSLAIFADSLCILEYHLNTHVDVWVMNDYGVGNSWCKLFSVEQPRVSRSCVSLSPLAYSKSQKDVLIVVDNKKLMWYNLKRKEFKTVKIANAPDVFDIEVFTESLVPPDNNFSCAGKQMQKQPQEKRKQQQQQKRNKRDNFLSKGFKLVL
ncbi:F-box domain-containing protein [Heracleum sosnowskyi]|uniref:F-box domain-containing protein n=1 Tax=Heracleum sosnowskyi TaxID=360622 RepID=A0AAD8MBY0_9APIA|nr:F-box domain-containing protein [Heracleum sosnowskyi]